MEYINKLTCKYCQSPDVIKYGKFEGGIVG